MEKTGIIDLRITGKIGAIELSTDNYDINDIRADINNIEDLLFPGDKSTRPIISYRIENGSVIQSFKTSLQYVIGFTAILHHIIDTNSIDSLDIKTAKAIESFQETAVKKDRTYTIRTSHPDTPDLIISKDTHYIRTDDIWVDTEFYFYGKITNAGGKEKANIHILLPEMRTKTILTPQNYLENLEKNILYKSYGIRASGKQNISTGEIDDLKFIELIDYDARYEIEYLKKLRQKAKSWIQDIRPDEFLNEIRGRVND